MGIVLGIAVLIFIIILLGRCADKSHQETEELFKQYDETGGFDDKIASYVRMQTIDGATHDPMFHPLIAQALAQEIALDFGRFCVKSLGQPGTVTSWSLRLLNGAKYRESLKQAIIRVSLGILYRSLQCGLDTAGPISDCITDEVLAAAIKMINKHS